MHYKKYNSGGIFVLFFFLPYQLLIKIGTIKITSRTQVRLPLKPLEFIFPLSLILQGKRTRVSKNTTASTDCVVHGHGVKYHFSP